MHAIIAAVIGALLSILLLKMARKRRLLGKPGGTPAVMQAIALILALAGLVLIVVGWLGLVVLPWAPWLVWAAVIVYLVTTVMRAIKRAV